MMAGSVQMGWDGVLLIAGTFVLAGLVKGVIGLGLPTVAVGLLSTAMPPAQAAAFLLVPSFVTNVWQLLAGPAFAALARRLWGMMAGIVLGTVAGMETGLLTGRHAAAAQVGLGIVLVAYAGVGLARLRLPAPGRHEGWLSPLVGAVTGLVTAATGVFVVPAVPYLGAMDLGRDDLVQALGLSFTASTVALAAGLAWHGQVGAGAAIGSVLAVLPALAGMAVGGWLRTRVGAETFRRCFFLGLLALGADLALRPGG